MKTIITDNNLCSLKQIYENFSLINSSQSAETDTPLSSIPSKLRQKVKQLQSVKRLLQETLKSLDNISGFIQEEITSLLQSKTINPTENTNQPSILSNSTTRTPSASPDIINSPKSSFKKTPLKKLDSPKIPGLSRSHKNASTTKSYQKQPKEISIKQNDLKTSPHKKKKLMNLRRKDSSQTEKIPLPIKDTIGRIPEMSENEFTALHKDIRGRISYKTFLDGVKEFNRKIEERKRVLEAEFNSLSDKERVEQQRVREIMRENEFRNVFLYTDDFKQAEVLKQDKQGRKIVEIFKMKKYIVAVRVGTVIYYFLNC